MRDLLVCIPYMLVVCGMIAREMFPGCRLWNASDLEVGAERCAEIRADYGYPECADYGLTEVWDRG